MEEAKTGEERKPLRKRSEARRTAVADISNELSEAMKGATTEEIVKEGEKKGLVFPSANRQSNHSGRDLRPDLQRIVETVWVTDMHQLWLQLRKFLRTGEQRSEHGYLMKALGEARSLSYDSHRLMITAKKEMKRWELENGKIHAAMWNKAQAVLQAEKATGHRAKQITDADVQAEAALLYPDEWAAQEEKRYEVKLTVDSMVRLAEEVSEYVQDLRVMLKGRG